MIWRIRSAFGGLALIIMGTHVLAPAFASEHQSVAKATEADRCQMKLAESYGLHIPFDGQDLVRALQKNFVKTGRISKVFLESQDHRERLSLDWQKRESRFKVSKISGPGRYPEFVDSETKLTAQHPGLHVAYRERIFKLQKPTQDKAVAVVVTANGEKITRIVAPQFACEFLGFFSCSCRP